MTIKTCSKCNRELPATTEFFSPNKTGIHGLYSICRKCKQPIDRERRKTRDKKKELEQKKEYYKNNRDRLNSLAKLHNHIRKIKVKQRTCTICNEEKKLQLASINHTYTENPKDYMWLCQSCHHLYDSSRGEKSHIGNFSGVEKSKIADDSKLPEPKTEPIEYPEGCEIKITESFQRQIEERVRDATRKELIEEFLNDLGSSISFWNGREHVRAVVVNGLIKKWQGKQK